MGKEREREITGQIETDIGMYYYIHITMQSLPLLEFLAEAFRCHVHHFQCLVVPVELAAMKLVFRFMVTEIAEMLMWLACVIVSKSVCDVCNVNLVYWLGIVYNSFTSHIVWRCFLWGLLAVCVKFLGLFKY